MRNSYGLQLTHRAIPCGYVSLIFGFGNEGMGPLVVMAGPTERDDPHGIEVIFVRVQRDRPKMVCMQLASLLTADAPITIAPKNCPPQQTPPRIAIDRPT